LKLQELAFFYFLSFSIIIFCKSNEKSPMSSAIIRFSSKSKKKH
jgi:hypothetical protein